MPSNDLLLALRQRPFIPFLIYASDGATYEVRHPELVMVGIASAVVGMPPPGQAQLPYERYEIVDLRHIVRLAPMPTNVSPEPTNNGP
jgi:hypothetical protein